MKTFAISALTATLLATQAFAADAQFFPSTYTTYKKHGPFTGEVQVLDTVPPVGKYIEIGLVRVSTDAASSYDFVDSLKKAAAMHGANALILEDDARLFSENALTERGTKPMNATATAVIKQ